MATTEDITPFPKTHQIDQAIIAVLRWIRWAVVAVGIVTLLALSGALDAIALPSAVPPSQHAPANDHLALDIMPVKPGGPAQDYAAYLPSPVLSVPEKSIVTVTIRNFDLDAIPLPDDSPYTHVQGTINDVAYVDGRAYSWLARTDIAHTFTVPALHLNVPIPGSATGGKRYVIVTFSFRTGTAGVYIWRCFAPCGDELDGLAGAMAEVGYMRGTLSVER